MITQLRMIYKTIKVPVLSLSIGALVLLCCLPVVTTPALAACPTGCACPGCPEVVSACSVSCSCTSEKQKALTIEHIKQEFVTQREWMIKTFFEQNILPALMLFTEQITAMAMHQVLVFGSFLDAKHQLESQRLFQEMMAQAHKDYQPSEGMCTFGTNVRSLAASDRNTDLSAITISNRVLQRELLSGNSIAGNGRVSDMTSRLAQFVELYCDKRDNGLGLSKLCSSGSVQKERTNKDINYTATVDSPLTLKLDFTATGDADHKDNSHGKTKDNPDGVASVDEEDLFALSANLYAHDVSPTFAQAFLANSDGTPNMQGVNHLMNIRAIAAKRSVARNSFASIAAMKAQGAEEVQPYLYAIMQEFGLPDDEIPKYLGKRPSYYAQMEVLTKKLYQHPNFYTELYDKPANVGRKTVSMQAIDLMQRRDMYRSILRSEAILSVMLETALSDQQDQITNEINRLSADGELIKLP